MVNRLNPKCFCWNHIDSYVLFWANVHSWIKLKVVFSERFSAIFWSNRYFFKSWSIIVLTTIFIFIKKKRSLVESSQWSASKTLNNIGIELVGSMNWNPTMVFKCFEGIMDTENPFKISVEKLIRQPTEKLNGVSPRSMCHEESK